MIEIIPALDIIDGKCVRLTQGDYIRKTEYRENPLEIAKTFEEAGIRRLHLVDLDGARASHIVNYRTLDLIAGRTNLIVDFGGGLKSDKDAEIAFDCGAQMITGGSIAVKNETLFLSWLVKYGSDRIILGADIKNEKIMTDGWSENSDEDLFSFLGKYTKKGIKKIISTDIDKDGMLEGPAVALYKQLREKFPEQELTASGGVANVSDIERMEMLGMNGVIIGKALYEGRITLKELSRFRH